MKDAIFVSHLVKLLPGDRKEEVKSKPTEAEAATYFLDKEIKPAIQSGDIESFTILLSAMETYGGIHVKKLAKQIKQEIEKVIQRNEPVTGKNMLFIAIATTVILNTSNLLGQLLYTSFLNKIEVCIMAFHIFLSSVTWSK